MRLETLPGVYAITNRQTQQRYIGSSSNPARRWISHRHELNAGKHRCPELQADWRTAGEAAFSFDVLTPSENLKHDEQRIITLHRRADWPLYNVRNASSAAVTTGAELRAILAAM